jgi:hypothetical protein
VLPLGTVGFHFAAMHRKIKPRPGIFLGPQATVLFGKAPACLLCVTGVRVWVEIMGLIIMRTDWDFPMISTFLRSHHLPPHP